MTVLDAFLEADNQTLIWTLIQQSVLFTKASLKDPENWFQSHIEQIYLQEEKAAATATSGQPGQPGLPFYQHVLNLNKKVIQQMLHDLQQGVPSLLVDQPHMSLSMRIENDTKMKFETEKDTPLKNLDDLVKARIQDLPPPPPPL